MNEKKKETFHFIACSRSQTSNLRIPPLPVPASLYALPVCDHSLFENFVISLFSVLIFLDEFLFSLILANKFCSRYWMEHLDAGVFGVESGSRIVL